MHLYLSDPSVLNTTFRNEDGQALYRVKCPHSLSTRTAKISRVVPHTMPDGQSSLQDHYAPLAGIDFKRTGASVLRFGDREVSTKDYFKKKGLGWNGRDRIFTGPDGLEYRWELGSDVSKLYLNDKGSEKTIIAQFHRRHRGIFHKARDASLEIFPRGERILDTIIMTFVYIEKRRQDSEDTTIAAAIAGGSA